MEQTQNITIFIRARAEYDQLRYDDQIFADLYEDNDEDFDEWYTEVYLGGNDE